MTARSSCFRAMRAPLSCQHSVARMLQRRSTLHRLHQRRNPDGRKLEKFSRYTAGDAAQRSDHFALAVDRIPSPISRPSGFALMQAMKSIARSKACAPTAVVGSSKEPHGRETSYFVQSFNAGKGGNLKADAPIACKSATARCERGTTGLEQTRRRRLSPPATPRWRL